LNRLDINHIASFLAVADELNYGRAAKRVGISQPSLSLRIQNMERALGSALFERDSRNVRLTPMGRWLLDEARRLQANIERIQRMSVDGGAAREWRLTVAAVPSALYRLLPAALARMRETDPRVHFEITEAGSADAWQMLRRKSVDVIVCRAGVAIPQSHMHIFPSESCMVALPRDHPAARDPQISLAALNHADLIVLAARLAPRYREEIQLNLRRLNVTPRSIHEVLSVTSQIALVAAGFGVAIVPESAQNQEQASVIFRRLVENITTVEHCVCWHSESTALAEKFVQALKEIHERSDATISMPDAV